MVDVRLIADAVDEYGKVLVREVLDDLRAKVEALPERWYEPVEDFVVIDAVLALIDEVQPIPRALRVELVEE